MTGIAWEAGVLQGLADRGEPVAAWDLVVGSSAGAFVGARLLGDRSIGPTFEALTSTIVSDEDEALRTGAGAMVGFLVRASRRPGLTWLAKAGVVPVALRALAVNAVHHGPGEMVVLPAILRSRKPGAPPVDSVRALGRLARGNRHESGPWIEFWERHLAPLADWPIGPLRIVVVDVDDGSRHVIDHTSGARLARTMAATSAVAAVVPPIEIGERRFMDGGSLSQTNADLAAGHDQVVVVAPVDRGQLADEIEHLRSGGSEVVAIRPGASATEAMGEELGRLDSARMSASALAGRADGTAASPLGG